MKGNPQVIEALNRALTVELCGKVGDNGTRDLIEPILRESEEHVDWLETQLSLVEDVGLPNYLTEQMGAADEE